MDFVCPICGGELCELEGRAKRCPGGHSFDRAKEGYYNLLLSAKGGVHGDNREMVEARRRFLERGYYEPLASKLGELVLSLLPFGGVALDAGCGEGYYTGLIEKRIYERDGESNMLAFDISRDAVKRAAKRNPRVSFAVASSYSPPLSDGCVDAVLNVFSPLAPVETARVLRQGGYFLFVYPDAEHLFSLKRSVYERPYLNEPCELVIPGLELLQTERLSYLMELEDAEAIRDLFMMTPYAYRTGRQEMERLHALDSLKCEAQFCISIYKKL